MSIADALADAAFANLQAVHGQRILILTGPDAGVIISGGIITVEAGTELSGDLSADLRERIMLKIPRTNFPPTLNAQHRISDATGMVWRVVKREQNPSQPFIAFELLQVIAGKDT